MGTVQGDFLVQGIPRNNATVKLWSAGDFDDPPSKNTALPDTDPVQSTVTGTSHGSDGSYRFTGVASGDYVASIEWNGLRVFHHHYIAGNQNFGFVNALDYPNLQAAINATASGGTLFIPRGVYNIDRSSTYEWTHPSGGTMYGLQCLNKPINFMGEGLATVLRAAASGVDVLTIRTDLTSISNSRITVSTMKFENPSGFIECNGLVMDRGFRNRTRDVHFQNFEAGIKLKTSWINNITDCYFNDCDIGVDCSEYWSGGGQSDGASHSMTFAGGEIQNCGIGILLHDQSMVDIYGTTIEGCTEVGVRASGCFKLTIHGVYWEQLGNAIDVELLDTWRDAWIDNAFKVRARSGYSLTLTNFRETSTASLDVDDTVNNILLFNPWTDESSTANLDVREDIRDAFERGLLATVIPGEPKANVFPVDDFGHNLIRNGQFADDGTGWNFTNMAVTGNSPPYGLQNVAYTTSTVQSTACSVACPVEDHLVPSGHICGTIATLSFWVKIPDSTWTATLQLVDLSRSRAIPIDHKVKDGEWHRVSALIRIGDAATTLQARINFTVGVSGIAYCAGGTLCLGRIPMHPPVADWALPSLQNFRRLAVNAARVSVPASGQINPLDAACTRVEGLGGAVVCSGQAFFTKNDETVDGLEIELAGADNTNTLTLVSGSTQKLGLGAATRTLQQGSILRLRYYHNLRGFWEEIAYKS